jgi:hypothetical protein
MSTGGCAATPQLATCWRPISVPPVRHSVPALTGELHLLTPAMQKMSTRTQGQGRGQLRFLPPGERIQGCDADRLCRYARAL